MIKIAYRVRGLFSGNYPENREDEQLQVNNRGDQLAVQALPELAEIVRLGNSYQVQVATGVAALTAYPTTVSALALYNGEAGGGPCYAIDSFGAVENAVDATQSDMTAIFAGIETNINVSAITDAALSIRSMSGRVYSGRAKTTTGGATTFGGIWYPHGPSAPIAPAAAGSGWKATDIPVRGLYLLPPQGRFALHAVKIAGAATQCVFFVRWHEVQIIYKS